MAVPVTVRNRVSSYATYDTVGMVCSDKRMQQKTPPKAPTKHARPGIQPSPRVAAGNDCPLGMRLKGVKLYNAALRNAVKHVCAKKRHVLNPRSCCGHRVEAAAKKHAQVTPRLAIQPVSTHPTVQARASANSATGRPYSAPHEPC